MRSDYSYLRDLAAASAEACLVRAGATVRIGTSEMRNDLGLDAYLPSGHAFMGYRALWLRDFIMSAPALSLTGDYLVKAARLFAASQKAEDWIWHNGHVPAWTPAEHINLDGGRCYYPGSYFPDERQGGRFGPWPPMDNAFYFIELVHQAFRAPGVLTAQTVREGNEPTGGRERATRAGDASESAIVSRSRRPLAPTDSPGADILREQVAGLSLFDRACRTYDAVVYHPETGLAWTPAINRAVDFGFCDCVHKIGQVLFGSCLAYQAANRLAEMAEATDGDATRWQATAVRIREHMIPTFGTPSGFLNAATDVCRQRDVWGTAFAVYVGALEGESREKACRALRDAYRDGTAVRDGAVRHILSGDDWSADSAWEYACAKRGTYQNGGYWLTASGWYLYAVAQVDTAAAEDMLADMVAHLRATDFRAAPGSNRGPYEWHNPDTGEAGKAVNLTSICCPLEALERINHEGLRQCVKTGR